MSNQNERFFTVSLSVTAGGSQFRPGICYKMQASVEPAIMSLVESGNAKLYDEEVRIVSGKPYPINKPQVQPSTQAGITGSPSSLSSKRGLTTKL